MSVWGIIIAAGLLTYAIRLSFIVLVGRREIPSWLRSALRFVPPAVLTAIVFPELLLSDGRLAIEFSNGRLVAGVLAIIVAWRTKNAILTILTGMLVLWGMQLLLG
ncbi:MAG: AzlD domain-containing protein [Anaerolineales bacterium]|nr:AzlD domain-containing protein [Anaerolineales bacterium]